MNININFLNKKLVGVTIPKPLSGTLSGHAAGEPFDKHVFAIMKEKYPKSTFRQYEYLNKLYLDNPQAKTIDQRYSLIKPKALAFLLNRGKEVTKKWTPSSQFEEKQNDTADILFIKNNFFNIIDIKTFNLEKKGQPPNIISAYKLAHMCNIMLKKKEFNTHNITYVGISWRLSENKLKAKEVSIKELFKSDPKKLYINWAAALQIQFHIKNLDQQYNGNLENWCLEYLQHFVKKAGERKEYTEKKFIKPFSKFLK